MNVYSVAKSNGRRGYVHATDEANARRIALQGEKAGVTVVRVTFVKKAS